MLEDETGCSTGQAERDRTFGNRRLLLHACLEVHVRAPEPLGERAGDAADLSMQLPVEPKTDAGGPSDELDGAVVMRRAEATGDDAEVGVHPFGERAGQLVLPVADDRDPRGLDPATQELGGQKG